MSPSRNPAESLACPMFCTIDKGKGIVKGKDILTAAMSNARGGGLETEA